MSWSEGLNALADVAAGAEPEQPTLRSLGPSLPLVG